MAGVFEHFPYTNFHDLNLDWILKHMREVVELVKSLNDTVGGLQTTVNQLESWYQSVISGNLDDATIAAIENWCENNLNRLLKIAVKNVWFGLTNTGYFCAYIPESWSDIVFNTTGYDITVPLVPEYGHLVLSMKVGEVI